MNPPCTSVHDTRGVACVLPYQHTGVHRYPPIPWPAISEEVLIDHPDLYTQVQVRVMADLDQKLQAEERAVYQGFAPCDHSNHDLTCVMPYGHPGHHQYLDDFEQKWQECGGGCGLVRGHDGEHQYSSWPEPPEEKPVPRSCPETIRTPIVGNLVFCSRDEGHKPPHTSADGMQWFEDDGSLTNPKPEPPADDDLCQQRRTVEGVDYFCTKRRGHSGFDTLHGQKRKEGGGFVATWSTEEPPNPKPATDEQVMTQDLCQDRFADNDTVYYCTKRRGHVGLHGLHRVGGGFVQTWGDNTYLTEERLDHLSPEVRRAMSTYVAGPQGDAVPDKYAMPVTPESTAVALSIFPNLPLPVKMRAAADVLEEANRMVPADPNNEWQPSVLRHDAEVWEREDAQKDEKARAVEELATFMSETARGVPVMTRWDELARKLIDAGWTKESR